MMTKRCLTLFLAALLLMGGLAFAEETGVAVGAYSLPVDFTPGAVPSESGYWGEWDLGSFGYEGRFGYSDPSISVSFETGIVDGTAYWIADIYLSDASQLRTISAEGFDTDGTDLFINLVEGQEGEGGVHPVLAINGDYYIGTGYGFIVRQGEEYLRRLNGLRDILLIDEDGDFHVLTKATKADVSTEIDGKKVINAFYFGPLLCERGRLGKFDDYETSWVMSGDWPSQRIALCQAGPLHYKVIATTGPKRGSIGMKMNEFAKFVNQQGVICAYNMDGGDSAALYFNGLKINDPENPNMRELSDLVYFASAWDGE